MSIYYFFFFKQKTAYEMRISDWSSDVCSSDLRQRFGFRLHLRRRTELGKQRIKLRHVAALEIIHRIVQGVRAQLQTRSEERRVGKECVSTCRSRWSPYH